MDLLSPLTFEMPAKLHLGRHMTRPRLFIKLWRLVVSQHTPECIPVYGCLRFVADFGGKLACNIGLTCRANHAGHRSISQYRTRHYGTGLTLIIAGYAGSPLCQN
jgi:hypothetical protein